MEEYNRPMGIFAVFILSLFLGVGVGQYYLKNDEPQPPSVLAENIEVPIETPTPTPIPSPTATLTAKPTPTITPTATPTSTVTNAPAWMESFFTESANRYHVDINLLKKIADCESHYNTGVVSPNNLYAGMFQFSASTWIANRDRMGKDNNSDLRFGAQESIDTAAYVISTQGSGAWPACSK